jgi:hypothetical protein
MGYGGERNQLLAGTRHVAERVERLPDLASLAIGGSPAHLVEIDKTEPLCQTSAQNKPNLKLFYKIILLSSARLWSVA